MKHTLLALILLLSGCALTSIPESYEGVRQFSHFGYDDAIELSNGSTKVILAPAMGGKVLSYSLNGKESLVIDESEQGWTYEATGHRHPFNGGGRFDIGNPKFLPDRINISLGRWAGEIIGDRQARLTSMVDPSTGLQLTRTFTLAPDSSKLHINMTMTNVLKEEVITYFWTRTFAKGGGIFVMPLTDNQLYPSGYVMFNPPKQQIEFRPQDPNIEMKGELFVLYDEAKFNKFGMETYSDWCAYLMKHDLLMLRQFPTYKEGAYTDILGGNFSLYYNNNYHGRSVAEIEPISPRAILKKGESTHFKEIWQLEPFTFPAERRGLDLEKIKQRAEQFREPL